jgi:hypothetical protein
MCCASKRRIKQKKAESVLRMPFVFRWVVCRGDYYIDGPKDGYPLEQEKEEQLVSRTGENEN